jgi:uncharacterized membrane protein
MLRPMLEERRPESGQIPSMTGAAIPVGETVPERQAARSRSAYRDWAVWVIAALVFGAYATISLFRLMQLNPSSWDLGIYTEYIKQIAHLHAPIVDLRGAGTNLLGDHFQPIVGLIAPFLLIAPSAATLLIAQALLTAVSVFPVAQAATVKLGTGPGRAIGAAYGFSWGLQQMVNFDFHEIAFAVPLLAFSLSALIRGRTGAAAAWALPLVFVKEDQGFTVAAIGMLMAISSQRAEIPDRRKTLAGQFLMVWGLAWSFLSIGVIIPLFNATHTYYYWKDGGAVGGTGGAFSLGSFLAQPFHGWSQKLQTSVMLLLPTAFTALGSPVALVVLPSMVLRFASTNSAYWGTYWHYNATVMPILFIAGIDAMARARARVSGGTGRAWLRPLRIAAERHGAAMMVAAAAALVFQFPLSTLWNSQTYQISPHVAAAEAAMARVPDGATVQTNLDLLAPLAARTDTFWIGNSGNPETQYIVFDGANSGYSPVPSDVPAFIAQLYPKAGYRQIYENGDVYVFKR